MTEVETSNTPENTPENDQNGRVGWRAALRRELRAHAFGYTVLALFVLAGPIGAALLFPQAPIGVVIGGGLAFGAYAALCAVPQKFI